MPRRIKRQDPDAFGARRGDYRAAINPNVNANRKRIKRQDPNAPGARRGEHRAAVNPNSGESVVSDREWENHKYIDKVKGKNGRIRYIYEKGPGYNNFGSNRPKDQHSANVLKETLAESDNRRKKEKEERNQRMSDLVQQMTLENRRKSEEKAHDIEMQYMLGSLPSVIGKFAPIIYSSGKRVLTGLSEGISAGSAFVSNALSSSMSNTPIGDLFK